MCSAIRDLRHVIAELRTRGEVGLADAAVEALDALVAENQRLRDKVGEQERMKAAG